MILLVFDAVKIFTRCLLGRILLQTGVNVWNVEEKGGYAPDLQCLHCYGAPVRQQPPGFESFCQVQVGAQRSSANKRASLPVSNLLHLRTPLSSCSGWLTDFRKELY